ncbi:unnamed protein product, partial [Closterium sp. NIES-53]
RSALRLPLVGDAALARAREARVVEGAVEEAVEEVEVVVGVVPGVGALVAAVEAVEAVAEAVEAAAVVVEVAEEVTVFRCLIFLWHLLFGSGLPVIFRQIVTHVVLGV